MNYKAKYLADNIDKAPYWKCKNSSDYMYTEEEADGALMWCVKTLVSLQLSLVLLDIQKKMKFVKKQKQLIVL